MNIGLQWFRQRTVREWISPWVLVALFAQAFIPGGYMAGGEMDGPLALCKVQFAPAADDNAPAQPDPDRTCHYCLAPALASPPIDGNPPSQPVATSYLLRLPAQHSTHFHPGPYRSQSPRAPPNAI